MSRKPVTSSLERRINGHLRFLVESIGPRPPGTAANRAASGYVASKLGAAGLRVDELPFTTRVWNPGVVRLQHHGETIVLPPSPFSRPAAVSGAIRRLLGRPDLEQAASGSPKPPVLVLDGALSAERYFPRSFPFVVIPEQRAILDLLERARPAAVLAVARPSDPDATDPVFEDPDLGFPYVTLPRGLGERLRDGDAVGLTIEGSIIEGHGANVSGHRPGSEGTRVVLSAHLDTKATTAGALDNASGVAVVLALAEMGRPRLPGLEYVFFNGEDHYAAPGEQVWLAARDLDRIGLVVNVDGPGLRGHGVSAAVLAVRDDAAAFVADSIAAAPPLQRSEPWIESDHAIFAMRGIPCLAVTTAAPSDLLARAAHAPESRVEDLDTRLLAEVAIALAGVAERIGARLGLEGSPTGIA
jgi:aminopeptidase YwaD